MGFPCDSAGKESACNVGDLGLIPGLGRSLEKGKVGLKSTFLFVVSGLFPQFLFLYFIFPVFLIYLNSIFIHM